MRGKISLLILSALILGACGSGADVSTDTTSTGSVSAEPAPEVVETTETPSETSAPSDSAIDESTADQGSGVTGEPAPDFSLALGDGSTFTLSDTDRPVYLVFWAEW